MTTPQPELTPDPGLPEYRGDDSERDAKRRRINKRTLLIAAFPATLILGILIGSGDSSSGETAAPEPEVRTETVTETVTEEVEVPVTPESCIAALAASERLAHEVVVPLMDEMWPQAIQAAAAYDVAAMEEISAEMDELTALTGTIVADYNAASTECRGA